MTEPQENPYCPICKQYAECVSPADGVDPDIRWCMSCGTLIHIGGRFSCPQDQEVSLLVKWIRDNPNTFHLNLNIIREYAGLPLKEGVHP